MLTISLAILTAIFQVDLG